MIKSDFFDVGEISVLIDSIVQSFSIVRTPPGGEYWPRVLDNLEALLPDGWDTEDRGFVTDGDELAGMLLVAFQWGASPQGADYWSEVHTNLDRIGSEDENNETSN